MYKDFKNKGSKVVYPDFELSNGCKIPALGLGTWKSDKSDVGQAVKVALETGYTHLDCARVYSNEREVGEVIEAKIADGTVKREELFITSKVWSTYMRPDLVRKCFDETLKDLKTDYLDLYLIHWPVALKEEVEIIPLDGDGNALMSDADYLDTWKEMEKLVDEGLVKSIGVSNFNSKQLQRLLKNCRIKPVLNQFECHPWLNQQALIDFCVQRGVSVTAYSPFGSPDSPWAVQGAKLLLEDPQITEIGAKYNKTPAQVLIRFAIQRGISVLPKSVTPSRIEENFQALTFKLSENDMETLLAMDKPWRAITGDMFRLSKHYPFNEDF